MYKESDFKNLQYNPLVKGTITLVYPALMVLTKDVDDDFDGHCDFLIRFIILCYEPNSLLAKNEKDWNRRKDVAADLLEISDDETVRENLFLFKDKNHLSILINYLRFVVRHREYAVLATLEYKFWESVSKINTPIIDNGNAKAELEAVQKKSVLADELDKDISRINSYYKAFFGGDEGLTNTEDVKRWTPEQINKKKS